MHTTSKDNPKLPSKQSYQDDHGASRMLSSILDTLFGSRKPAHPRQNNLSPQKTRASQPNSSLPTTYAPVFCLNSNCKPVIKTYRPRDSSSEVCLRLFLPKATPKILSANGFPGSSSRPLFQWPSNTLDPSYTNALLHPIAVRMEPEQSQLFSPRFSLIRLQRVPCDIPFISHSYPRLANLSSFFIT